MNKSDIKYSSVKTFHSAFVNRLPNYLRQFIKDFEIRAKRTSKGVDIVKGRGGERIASVDSEIGKFIVYDYVVEEIYSEIRNKDIWEAQYFWNFLFELGDYIEDNYDRFKSVFHDKSLLSI